MASLGPLLCVLLALSSRVLGDLGSGHANLPPDCEYSSMVHIPKGTTETFFVSLSNLYSSLKIVLNQLNCLDEKEREQKYMKKKDFPASKWSEVQLSVDEQGYRVRVDGQEKMTAKKKASCYKVTGVDVYAYKEVLSVDCDPRFEENTSTSPVTTNETSIASTLYITETSTAVSIEASDYDVILLRVNVIFVVIGFVGSLLDLILVAKQVIRSEQK